MVLAAATTTSGEASSPIDRNVHDAKFDASCAGFYGHSGTGVMSGRRESSICDVMR